MENIKSAAFTKKKASIQRESKDQMPMLKNNFILMAIAGILIVVGFILISGSGSTLEQYNSDIFSNKRIVIGPALSFIGFVMMAISIIVKPKSGK